MNHTPAEQTLLARLASGALDGRVGDEREYRVYNSVYCGKLIRNGTPFSYRQGEPTGTKRAEEIPNREEETFDTEDRKLEFLRRYGWLMNDDEVRAYSALYKPKAKENK